MVESRAGTTLNDQTRLEANFLRPSPAFASQPVSVESNRLCFLLQSAAVQTCTFLNSLLSYLASGGGGERMRSTGDGLLSRIDQ